MSVNAPPNVGPSRLISTTRWALLAASLALIVGLLVIGNGSSATSLTAASPAPFHGGTQHPHDEVTTKSAPRSAPLNTASPFAPITNAQAQRAPASTGPSTTSLFASTGSSKSQTTPGVPTTTQSTATQPTTTQPTTPPLVSVATVTPTTTAGQREVGWLQGPSVISATYFFSAGSARSVTATWTGAPTLVLSVTCDGTTTQTSGVSNLSLTAHGSSCSVTLSGPSTVATTTFAIVVGGA